ncbi:MAG: AMIN domain-containing protein [Spirulina sp. SIO3F2]|nr:AMIN domain-containing protein [Spirulina sp. SIO3F2]
MRAYSASLGFVTSAVVALVAAQPAQAASTQIVDVEIQRGNGEFAIVLTTAGSSESPQILTIEQGNSLIANIRDSQINVNGNTTGFRTDAPVSGIESVTLEQVDANTVRLVVTGVDQLPVGQVRQQGAGTIVVGFTTTAGPDRTAAQLPTLPPALPTAVAEPETNAGVEIEVQPSSTFGVEEGETAIAPTSDPSAAVAPRPVIPPATTEQSAATFQLNPEAFQISQSTPRSDVFVPDPEITIDGAPAGPASSIEPLPTAPPFLPRAVPPHVGDIAVANYNIVPNTIDLGSNLPVHMRIENAEVGTVLQALARLADMNVIVMGGGAAGDAQGAVAGEGTSARITLELQGESLQDAFNYVLQASGLDASRRGRTITIASRLPAAAQNLVSRTFRINQADAQTVATFMATQGAEVQTVFQEEDITVDDATGEITTTAQAPTVTSIAPADNNDSYLPLRGLAVSSDSRLNTVTVTGEQGLVELATNFIQQLDLRVRQVAVNVKIIDVNLQNIGRIGTSFSFGINEAGFINQGGIGIINFGDGRDIAPFTSNGLINTNVGNAPVGNLTGAAFTDAGDFIAQLQATLENNNAKVVTDPTLIVQEGQSATVQLTQEVVTDVNVERDVSDGVTTITVNTETEDVGLTLGVAVARIDDNGFVSMIVTPTVTAVGNTQTINAGGITNTIALVSTRSVESGTIRMRDGQTLVLSGIIQDQDTVATAKLPFLGDLPLIGTLFRRTTRTTDRREVIVLVTPNVMDDVQPFGYNYVHSDDQQRVPFPQ